MITDGNVKDLMNILDSRINQGVSSQLSNVVRIAAAVVTGTNSNGLVSVRLISDPLGGGGAFDVPNKSGENVDIGDNVWIGWFGDLTNSFIMLNNTKAPLFPGSSSANLLDNSSFLVAQAGYGGLHGTQVYAADRWGKTDGSATFSSAQGGGLAIAVTQPGHIFQRIENVVPGETYTVAASVNGAVYVASGTWPESGTSFGVSFTGGNLYVDAYFGVVVFFASSINIQWVRLLRGSYTPKTLPPWEPTNYSIEMIKCQYFYRRDWVSYQAYAPGSAFPGFSYPAPMRVNPTVNIYDETGAAGYIAIWGQQTAYKVASTPATKERLNCVMTETTPQTVISCAYLVESIADL